MQSLQQRVDILDNNFQSNEEIELMQINECVIIGNLKSMLNFVYALFVIGEEDYATMLLQKPGQCYNIEFKTEKGVLLYNFKILSSQICCQRFCNFESRYYIWLSIVPE